MASSDEIYEVLSHLQKIVGALEDACDEYGGWAGRDEDARDVIDLGIRLTALGHVVGLFGREVAEGGRRDG